MKMVLISFFCISTCCFASSSMPKDSNSFLNSPDCWIEQNKMRAGYLYFDSPLSEMSLVKELDLNTIILKCWQFNNAKDKLNTVKSIKRWAILAKRENIHLFVGVNWQPYPYMDKLKYEKVVYADGSDGVAVCPFDKNFWNNHLQEICLLIANLSMETALQIDGIFLDMEIYGSEKESHIRRDYFEKSCGYGDNTFSQYLIYKNYQPSKFPAIEKKDRKSWLSKENLLDGYFVFLREQVQTKAEALREAIYKINPDFLIGMYPHPDKNNWVQYPLAQGFGSERLPVIIFGIHSYGYFLDENSDGYTFIPKDIIQQYKTDGINSLYCAGFLFRKYSGDVLERNLQKSIENWNGYWLYNINQLWKAENNIISNEKLIDSSENLKQAIIKANLK